VSAEKPREIAARVLGRRPTGDFIENLLDQALARARLSPLDRRLCQELVYGIVRWQATLDWLIARKTPGRTQKPALQDLLRLGLYQIFWLERIPNHAAVNETVEQAKRDGFGPQAGFVNAVLRGYLREFEETQRLLKELKSSQPHLGYSHPEWLVSRWLARYGAESTAGLLDWNNTPPKTYARVNTLKMEPGKLLEQWRLEGVEYDFARFDWVEENLVFELKSHPSLETLPSFQQGGFYVQDPSTLLAVRLLDPKPGHSVLDLCAAPGGKLGVIAQRMQNQGRLVAYDLSPSRMQLLEQNCRRLGVHYDPALGGPAEVALATTTPPAALGRTPFARILVDAPCSNTGVMRRRVDVRWRIQPAEIQRLRTSQLELLQHAAAWVQREGKLVYSTCSLEPEENRQVINEFLAGRNDFRLDQERELRPFVEQVDGAYVAVLVRGG
jgi:16S rRNA (cytosine967-C5)-methyltransferase